MEELITAQNLTKVYHLYDRPLDRIKETFHPFHKKYHRDFYALRDVSFKANRGDIIGIIGKNGAGKSTLLQIITGVLSPTSGAVSVRGKVAALLELGAGFNPDLSGIENVFFQSSLMGYSNDEVQKRLDGILNFADIGDFIHQPVKTYSSGMFVRLAFAVAINVDPDILIIDEALSVGDFRFRQKCIRTMNDFIVNGKTVLFVSHDSTSIAEFCNKAIWLMDGTIYDFGDPKYICNNYLSFMSYGMLSYASSSSKHLSSAHNKISNINSGDWADVSGCDSFGDRFAEITRVNFFSVDSGKSIRAFDGGCRVVFAVEITVNKTINNAIVGFHMNDPKGNGILGINTDVYGKNIGTLFSGTKVVVEFEFDFPILKAAQYSFSPAIAEGSMSDHIQHHWVHDAYLIQVTRAEPAAKLGHYLVLERDKVSIRRSDCS